MTVTGEATFLPGAAPRVTRSRLNLSWLTGIVALVIVAAFAILPYEVYAGTTAILGQGFVILTLASMWNLLAGYGGLVSVGQQAFLGLGARAEHAIGKPGQGAPMRLEVFNCARSGGRHAAAVFAFGKSRSTGRLSPPITSRVQAWPWPSAYLSVGYMRAARIRNASETRPRRPQWRTISSRRSSASGAWRRCLLRNLLTVTILR